MALYSPGPTVAEIRGSIGGTTYSRNRAGLYMRARSKPVNGSSPAQDLVRAAVAACQLEWTKVMTSAMRSAWNEAAALTSRINRLGQPYNMTGHQAFLSANVIQALVPLPFITTAPEPPLRYTPGIPLIDQAADEAIKLESFTPTWATGNFAIIWTSTNVRRSVNYFKGPWTGYTLVGFVNPLPKLIVAKADLLDGMRRHLLLKVYDGVGRVSETVHFSVDTTVSP